MLCVLEGIKISILSVGVLAKRSVCLEGIKVTFLVVFVSDLGLISYWCSSVVSKKTGCSSGFRVNQYKSLCAFSLSLNSLNSILIFANWYKQPDCFCKTTDCFFLVQLLFALVLAN